jgi:hypothetical protein
MPTDIVRVSELPKATRNKSRLLETTDEWMKMKAKIADGLRPYEAITAHFTQGQIEKMGMKHPARNLRDMAKKFIRDLKLEYDVERYKSGETEYVVVAARGIHGNGVPREESVSTGGHNGAGGLPAGRSRRVRGPASARKRK